MNAIQHWRATHKWGRVAVVLALVATTIIGAPSARAVDRGRPTIVNGTIKTDQGTLMRGGTFWIFGNIPQLIDWANNITAWDTMFVPYRLNCVRLACGYNLTDIYPPTGQTIPLSQFLTWLDTWVQRASDRNMYAVIDFHPCAGCTNMARAQEFWNAVAPRYANRTHVIYEIHNEPVGWRAADYTSTDINNQTTLYNLCHNAAPNTSIIITSFAVTDGAVPMANVVNQVNVADWTRTTAGFHGYWVNTSSYITALRASRPCFNTEFMHPGSTEMLSMDGELWQTQTMERLGISWIMWDNVHDSNASLRYVEEMQADAQSKGYWWPADGAPQPPPVPTGLTATAGNAQVALSWNASTGATAYDVKRSTVSGSGYVVVSSPTGTSYTNTGLTNGTTYYFVVAAKNASGSSANSSQVSATPQASVPPVPTGLTATPGNGQVALSWNASSGATAYDVKRSTVSGSGYVVVSSPTTTSYTNTGLTNGTTYYFVVAAKNASGSSANSAQVSATPTASTQAQIASGTATIDGTVEAAWNSATAYNINNVITGTVSSSADLSGTWKGMWDATNLYLLADITDDVKGNDSASAYDDDTVELFVDGNNSKGTTYDGANDIQWFFGWGDTAVVEGSGPAGRTTGITFAKVDPTSTTYRIELKIPWSTIGVTPAANALIGIDVQVDDDDTGTTRDGKKAWWGTTDIAWQNPSAFGTGKLNAAGGSPPPAPTGLTATGGNTQISLAWNASTGATSYKIYSGTCSGCESFNGGTTTGTSFIATGATNGTTYYYKVTAVNANGESGFSNEAFATANASTATNIWSSNPTPATVDANDPNTGGVELGCRFRSDVAGKITGVRFYKASTNTGTHTAHLWSNTGTSLGAFTFSGESASGWQTGSFASPINISANTTYVVSYHTNNGHYSANSNYFATAGANNLNLHALQNGVDGANGVYAYGAGSSFPSSTFQSTNYWVDVVFAP